jgi:dTDP-4-dehydrorhamnose reductase
MKYLIIGNGWLGNIIKNYLGESATLVGRNFDLTAHDFDVLINTAAKTNIDWCEQNKWETVQSNVLLAYDLAKWCKEHGKKYVFFSSACIFESKDKYDIKDETSRPNPQCFYTETKVMAEKVIQEINPEALILRPRLPLSEVPHPRNTINKLLGYAIINNVQETVTVVEDMLPVMVQLIEESKTGVFHLVNEGTIAPSEIARLFNHQFQTATKKQQNVRLAREGKTKRVTTYATSIRIPLLPNIRSRIKDLAEKYKSHGRDKVNV